MTYFDRKLLKDTRRWMVVKTTSMRRRYKKLESERPVGLWKEEKTVSVAEFWLVYFYARQAKGEK